MMKNLRSLNQIAFPTLRYVTYVFTGYKKDVNWDCNATVRYTEPCHGCSRCYKEQQVPDETANTNRRWWQAILPRRIAPSMLKFGFIIMTMQ